MFLASRELRCITLSLENLMLILMGNAKLSTTLHLRNVSLSSNKGNGEVETLSKLKELFIQLRARKFGS